MFRKIGMLMVAALLLVAGFLTPTQVLAAPAAPSGAAALAAMGSVKPPASIPKVGTTQKVTASTATLSKNAKTGVQQKRDPGTSPKSNGQLSALGGGGGPWYYYVTGQQHLTSNYPTTLAGSTKVWDSYLDTDDYHTLQELAAIKTIGGLRQIVEIGLNVDDVVNGDYNTHLFGFAWKNGAGVGYNTSGTPFVPYTTTPTNPITLGMTVPYGAVVQMGIVYDSGNWWLWASVNDNIANAIFDGVSHYVGYYPGSLWTASNAYGTAVAGFVNMDNPQAFGEVAAGNVDGSGNAFKPCTDMGALNPDAWSQPSDTAYWSTLSYNTGISVPAMTWAVYNPAVFPSFQGYSVSGTSGRGAFIGGVGADSSGNDAPVGGVYPGNLGWC